MVINSEEHTMMIICKRYLCAKMEQVRCLVMMENEFIKNHSLFGKFPGGMAE